MLSLYSRAEAEGSFEALFQKRELRADGNHNYTEYVPEYHWEPEESVFLAEWFAGCKRESCITGAENGFDIAVPENGYRVAGAELVRSLCDAGAGENIPALRFFTSGFGGAAVRMEQTAQGSYFIVKKYGDAHQAGFQSLYIGSLDTKSGKLLQCEQFAGDYAQAEIIIEDGQLRILFCTETQYNGILSATGGILQEREGELCLVWPTQAQEGMAETGTEGRSGLSINSDDWKNRTAKIENGILKIYEVIYSFTEEGYIGGYTLNEISQLK